MSRTTALVQTVLLLFGASALTAQELSELCPNSDPGTGAIWGVVSDVDAQMALPGATVRAAWETDGAPARADTQTGFDGSFTLCYLPLEIGLSVQAMVANLTGQPVSLTLTEPITHQDIGFSLTGGAGGGAEDQADANRMWACIGAPDSQIRLQLGSLVRCDPQWQPLEQCPKEELGTVSASSNAGGRGALREMIDQLIDQAERLGANALTNFGGGRGSVNAIAVRIDVDPSTC